MTEFPPFGESLPICAQLIVMLGTKGNLTEVDAEGTARSLAEAMAATACPICFCIGGYDDDPRELTSIPEAMAYWRLVLVKFNQIVDLQVLLPRLDADSMAITQVAFGLAQPLPPSKKLA